jgi:DNA-binding GntR family transcriptional regulator
VERRDANKAREAMRAHLLQVREDSEATAEKRDSVKQNS